MKIKFNRVRFERKTSELVLSSDDTETLLKWARNLSTDLEYELECKPAKAKRSLDANGYAWVLIQKLAKVYGLTPIEVYKQIIIDMYTYTDECIKEQDFDRNKREWEEGHYGRSYEYLYPSKSQKGWIFIRKHRSSSDYDTREMSHFLDLVIFECQQEGVETRTPEEIAKLKDAWV